MALEVSQFLRTYSGGGEKSSYQQRTHSTRWPTPSPLFPRHSPTRPDILKRASSMVHSVGHTWCSESYMPNKNFALLHTKQGRGPLHCELQIFKAKKDNSVLNPNPSFCDGRKVLLKEDLLTCNLKPSITFNIHWNYYVEITRTDKEKAGTDKNTGSSVHQWKVKTGTILM